MNESLVMAQGIPGLRNRGKKVPKNDLVAAFVWDFEMRGVLVAENVVTRSLEKEEIPEAIFVIVLEPWDRKPK
jgi:hypothetical protein